jgi:hypothetical protein
MSFSPSARVDTTSSGRVRQSLPVATGETASPPVRPASNQPDALSPVLTWLSRPPPYTLYGSSGITRAYLLSNLSATSPFGPLRFLSTIITMPSGVSSGRHSRITL